MPDARIAPARLCRFMTVALERLGLPPADAAIGAQLMTDAEVQGSDGHGAIRPAPSPPRPRAAPPPPPPPPRRAPPGEGPQPGALSSRGVEERPAMALLDGDNGFGHL